MDEMTSKEIFLSSLDRCTQSSEFIPTFYDRFVAASPEVKRKFARTDFAKQNKMLLRSLKLAAAATAGEPEGLREITERAESHDRHHLNIKSHLYELWLTALLDAARRFDNQWDTATEAAWNTILGHIIHRMTKFY
jgi:hemoglobin-like flavoprotein